MRRQAKTLEMEIYLSRAWRQIIPEDADEEMIALGVGERVENALSRYGEFAGLDSNWFDVAEAAFVIDYTAPMSCAEDPWKLWNAVRIQVHIASDGNVNLESMRDFLSRELPEHTHILMGWVKSPGT